MQGYFVSARATLCAVLPLFFLTAAVNVPKEVHPIYDSLDEVLAATTFIGRNHPLPHVVKWPHKCDTFPNGKCAPAVVLAGIKKCGTNSVEKMLQTHPSVHFPAQSKEGKAFIKAGGGSFVGENWFLDCGIAAYVKWAIDGYGCQGGSEPNQTVYSKMFDHTDWKTSFALDRSPLTLIGPSAAVRLQRIAPNARIVVVVSDPVVRAWSSINHENKRWVASDRTRAVLVDERLQTIEASIQNITDIYGTSFEGLAQCMLHGQNGGAVALAMPHAQICREVLLPGLYFDAIKQFWHRFRQEQIIMVDGAWFFENQLEGTEALFRALGVPASLRDIAAVNPRHRRVHANRGVVVNEVYRDASSIPPKLKALLNKFYAATREKYNAIFTT